jgi:hypothetical protein
MTKRVNGYDRSRIGLDERGKQLYRKKIGVNEVAVDMTGEYC